MKNLHLCNPPETGNTQFVLGHNSSKTIAVYTRVNKKFLANTKSSLNVIFEYRNIDNQYFKINYGEWNIKEINAICGYKQVTCN